MRPAIVLLTLLALGAGAACPAKPVAAQAPVDPAKYAAYFTAYPFGGHTTDVWRDRLEELKPGGAAADAAVYALTIERAQKNGLVVEESGGHIVVKPNAELSASLMKRLDVK